MPAKKKSVKADAVTEPQKAQALPDWPPLRPLVPTCDLSLDTILEDQIVIIRNFFTSTLCKQYVAFLSTLSLVTTPGRPKRGVAVRVNDRIQFNDPAFANMLWMSTGLESLIASSNNDAQIRQEDLAQAWGGQVVGLNPNIRIYRYREGQFFDQHCRWHSFLAIWVHLTSSSRSRNSINSDLGVLVLRCQVAVPRA